MRREGDLKFWSRDGELGGKQERLVLFFYSAFNSNRAPGCVSMTVQIDVRDGVTTAVYPVVPRIPLPRHLEHGLGSGGSARESRRLAACGFVAECGQCKPSLGDTERWNSTSFFAHAARVIFGGGRVLVSVFFSLRRKRELDQR